MNLPVSRPVEFTEEYGLPVSQHELTSLDQDLFGGPDEGGLDMGIRVAFPVLVPRTMRDQRREMRQNVLLNRGICSFVDCDGRRRVRHKQEAVSLLKG